MSSSVVFLHSTGTGPAMWDRAFAALGPVDARLVALPNVGYPPAPPLERGAKCLVGDQVSHLAARLPDEPFHLVAHSFGAFLALKMLMAARTARIPELSTRLRSLWLWEPVLYGALGIEAGRDGAARAEDSLGRASWVVSDETRGGTDEWLEVFVDYWNGPGAFGKLPESAKAPMRAFGWTMFQEVRATALDEDPFDDYRIDVPCTLAHGSVSPLASQQMVSALARVNPEARIESHDGLGHMAPLSRPRPVAASIEAHLERHGVRKR